LSVTMRRFFHGLVRFSATLSQSGNENLMPSAGQKLCMTTLLATFALARGGVAWAQSAIVETTAGKVEGVEQRVAGGPGVISFKGIPYAAPPVGPLRWKKPEPVAAWEGIRKADAYSAACIQMPGLSAANGGEPGPLSEDCLYLNVWTPKADAAAKLPVMVWIHGGAFIFGAGGLPLYDGGPLASKGAVFVSMNYRLGALGFFAHPALEKENPGGPVNFGLLDQIAALQWIRKNIAQFGGDPGNVTIFGQSAGAKSVLALFASPLARGLFQKGIAMSSYSIPDATRAKAIEVGIRVADEVGLPGAKASADELRAVPAERFEPMRGQELSLAPVPVSGDEVLPRSIANTFAAGKEAPLPLILGDTSDDSSVVAAFGIDPAEVVKKMRGAGMLLKALYPGVRNENELARQAVRDVVFTLPVRVVADRHSKLAPSWRYYFDYIAVNSRHELSGVQHGGEIAYALDTCDIYELTKNTFTNADRDYARRVSEFWFQFAKVGKPISEGSPSWPSDTAARDRTMLFGESMQVKTEFMRARLNVFIAAGRILATFAKPK
jgi:para-nitrobenzyl esterase